jgi:putative oxidoreductase
MLSSEAANILLIVGRVLLGGLFVYGGVNHFVNMPPVLAMVAARSVPFPRLVLIVGSLWELALGLMLALGLWVTPAALGLVVFTILATVMLLNFWDKTGPEREGMKVGALTNGAVVGGLLIAAAGG